MTIEEIIKNCVQRYIWVLGSVDVQLYGQKCWMMFYAITGAYPTRKNWILLFYNRKYQCVHIIDSNNHRMTNDYKMNISRVKYISNTYWLSATVYSKQMVEVPLVRTVSDTSTYYCAQSVLPDKSRVKVPSPVVFCELDRKLLEQNQSCIVDVNGIEHFIRRHSEEIYHDEHRTYYIPYFTIIYSPKEAEEEDTNGGHHHRDSVMMMTIQFKIDCFKPEKYRCLQCNVKERCVYPVIESNAIINY